MENLISTLLQHIQTGVLVARVPNILSPGESHVVKTNEAVERVLGIPASAYLGKPFKDIGVDLESPPVEGLTEARRTGEARALTNYNFTTPRVNVWLNLRFVPVVGTHEVIVFIDNVTRQHRTEVELDTVSARYRAIVESSPDMLHLMDTEGRFLDTHVGSIFPTCRPEEYVGKTVHEVFPRDTAEAILTHIRWTLEHQQVSVWQYTLPQSPGHVFEARFVEIHAAPAGTGEVMVIIRDITEQQRVLDALHESEECYRTTFEQALVGQVRVGTDGRFIRVNQTFATMLGYTPEEMVGMSVLDVTHPDDFDMTRKIISTLFGGVEPVQRSILKRYTRKDGGVVWGEVNSHIVRRSDGTPKFASTHILDVTDRVEAQTRLEALVEARTIQLRQTNEALQQFAYAASHDLREPLNKITAFGQRLGAKYADRLDEKGQQYLEIMQTAAGRMTHLIDDLLEFSRIGREEAPLMRVDLNRVLQEVQEDLDLVVQNAGAEIEVEQLPEVIGHSMRFRQVFQNLLSNAIKFQRPGVPPKVRVTGRVESGWAIIDVSDNGIGFDPQYADSIFTLFKRLHTRFEYPGTGIGLAMCRRILDAYGGTITARGVPNGGATFTVRIPVGGHRG